jgi:hypothetical protein
VLARAHAVGGFGNTVMTIVGDAAEAVTDVSISQRPGEMPSSSPSTAIRQSWIRRRH